MVKRFIRNIYFRVVYNLYIKRKINQTVTESLGGFKFKVYPSVFNPLDYISSPIFADFIKLLGLLEGKRILDMGTGSGVVSVFAASGGAECISADINPMAVRSARENAAVNGFADKVTAVESDLFEALNPNDLFDLIFFNPPYYKGNPHNNFERAFKGGENLEVITRFLNDAKKFLKHNGVIYFIVSSDMDIQAFFKMIESAGYTHKIVKEIKKFFETFYIISVVV